MVKHVQLAVPQDSLSLVKRWTTPVLLTMPTLQLNQQLLDCLRASQLCPVPLHLALTICHNVLGWT